MTEAGAITATAGVLLTVLAHLVWSQPYRWRVRTVRDPMGLVDAGPVFVERGLYRWRCTARLACWWHEAPTRDIFGDMRRIPGT